MIHAYDRGRYVVRALLQDAVVIAACALGAWTGGPWGKALATAGMASLAWGLFTLHFPSKVAIDEVGIAFSAYGLTHTFAWREVARVHVRRFLVKDRVLVRLLPARPWRGRYWLTDGLDGYADLVSELERRARDQV